VQRYFPRSRGVKLNPHIRLVPRLRMRGAIAPIPIRLHGAVIRSGPGQFYL